MCLQLAIERLVEKRGPLTRKELEKYGAQSIPRNVRRRQLGAVGLSLMDSSTTVAQLKDRWWQAHVEPHLSARTKEFYSGIWSDQVEPRLGTYPVGQVTTQVVQNQVVNAMSKAGVGKATIVKALSILSSIFRLAVSQGLCSANPCKDVIRPRDNGTRRMVRPPSLEEVEKIRRRLIVDGRLRDTTLISVLGHVGLRPSEAFALEWSDVDLDRMQVVVDKSLDLDGTTKSTKTRRNRVASIPRVVKADLRAWRRACDTNLVFPRSDGFPVDRGAWNNWRKRTIGPIQDDLGLPRFRFYDLRHTAVSARLSAGQNLLQVAYETGHDPSVISRRTHTSSPVTAARLTAATAHDSP